MTATELLQEVRARGGRIALAGENLRLSGHVGSLSEELRQKILDHKSQIMAILREEENKGATILPKDGPLPLSHFQERLWIIQQLDPSATEYNLVTVWAMEHTGAEALEAALRNVVTRHSILRTVFHETPTGPEAEVLEPDCVSIVDVDLSDLNEAQSKQALAELVERETHRVFELDKAPPARFVILNLANGDTALLVAVHHIAIDHWSLSILRRELTAALSEPSAYSKQAGLPEYADYAGWQRRRLDPSRLSEHLDWWEKKLGGHPEMCTFHADLVPGLEPEGTSRSFVWDRDFSERLQAFANERNISLYICLLAAASIALHRHTGLEDIVLGSPVALRERAEFEGIIGPFVNTQVLRMDLSSNPSVAEVLEACRTSMLDSFPHSHVPFEMVVDRLQPVRSLNRSPLFQFAVVLQNADDTQVEPIFGGGAIHDMTWIVRTSGGQVMGAIEYRSDIYLGDTVERIIERLELILRCMLQDPEIKLADIPLLSQNDRRILSNEFIPTEVECDAVPYPVQFSRIAEQVPDSTAIRHEGESVSYAALAARANRIARYLSSLGIGPGQVVGLCLDRTPDLIASIIAVQKTGAAHLPLDPGFPEDRLNYILSDSRATAVLTGEGTAGYLTLPEDVTEINLHSDTQVIDAMSPDDLDHDIDPDSRAHLIYTSGSTGRPKGVQISHRAMSNLLAALRDEPGMSPNDIVAATTTASFDIAAVELQLPLTVGATIELISREVATNGEDLAAALAACGATVVQATPSAWRLLIEGGWKGGRDILAITGGEPLTRDLADDLLDRVGSLWNGFGPSETTIYSTGAWITPGRDAISIGRPVRNTRVLLLDETGELVPIGMQGEICIGGAGVFKGYVGKPEQTEKSLVSDPLLPQNAPLYRTGDIGRWAPNGQLYHLGRRDNQVKIRGVRIELGEIEASLLASPQIRQAAVLVHDSGHGDLRLVAYLVFEDGEELTASEVRRNLRATLPRYMIPSVIMELPKLPMTPGGKLDRRSLPAPFRGGGLGHPVAVPPRPGMERALADIWADVLQVDDVGADDNFFELGGHSLITLRVAKRVRSELGLALDPRLLFFKSLRQIALELTQQLS
ncbi:MAG: amino acid adenylation domain-containing protein [Heliomarina sp.]|uniref:amino acid adenylation domain-containing protein n=1 Tax=Heliomarina sp. TaxID=2917556 RepID=UPI0040586CBE